MLRALLIPAALVALVGMTPAAAPAATIIDTWSSVQAPTPPPLQSVKIDPATTALLVMDLVPQTCNPKDRPYCLPILTPVSTVLKAARSNKLMVVYSLVPGTVTNGDILPQVAPLGGEPVVRSGPDKFIGTDLESILKSKGIKTVILTGTSINGAVGITAQHAALLGYDVVVPLDCSAGSTPYAEQLVAWDLVNAPLVAAKVKLTRSDMLSY